MAKGRRNPQRDAKLSMVLILLGYYSSKRGCTSKKICSKRGSLAATATASPPKRPASRWVVQPALRIRHVISTFLSRMAIGKSRVVAVLRSDTSTSSQERVNRGGACEEYSAHQDRSHQ